MSTPKKKATRKATATQAAASTKVKEVIAETIPTVETVAKAKVEAIPEVQTPVEVTPETPKINIFIQYAGKQISEEELVDKIRADYSGEICKLSLYVKPEDSAVYYVANDGDTGVIYF